MAETKKSGAIAKAEEKAVVPASSAFEEYAGSGMENVGSSDILIPRLTILQDLSPQVKKMKPEYIEGAEVGMICDVGAGEIFPNGIRFLPVHYSKVWLEWAPRGSDKGLIAIHSSPEIMDHTTRNDRNQPVLENGNLVSETAQFFGLNLTADGRRSFIPMSSTMLKRAKRWLTLATGEKLERSDGSRFTPPLWYRTYVLTTVADGNAQGDWTTWKIERGEALPELPHWEALKEECIAFQVSLASGEARGEMGTREETVGGETTGKGDLDDEVPF